MDNMDIKREIMLRQVGAKIAYYRTLRGLHQEQLAGMTHISKSVLSRIERGKYNNHVSVSMLIAIAEALRVEPGVFLSFNEDEKKMWWEDLSSEHPLPCGTEDETDPSAEEDVPFNGTGKFAGQTARDKDSSG